MDVAIQGDMIRLGQLLKFSGVVSSGDQAKAMLAEGGVRINGKPETRRGRQIHVGDIVHAGGEQIAVVSGLRRLEPGSARTSPARASPGV